MPEEKFFSLLTKVGAAQLSNAMALGQIINVTELAVGDGVDGAYYAPTERQTELRNEVFRGAINNKYIDSQNPNRVVFELAIPAAEGPWSVREAGVFDDAGNMIAVAKLPETYKPALVQGSGKDLLIKFILQTSNAALVNLLVDPSVVLASHKKVADDIAAHAAAHAAAADPHPSYAVPQATETLVGKVELASVPEAKTGTDTVRAVTPAGLSAALAGERKRDMLERLLSAMQDSSTNPALNVKPETYEDLSGVDTDASSGYIHDAAGAFLHNAALYGSNLASGATVSVSGTGRGNSAVLNDGSVTSIWRHEYDGNGWWKMQFRGGKTLTRYRAYLTNDATVLTSLVLTASNSGAFSGEEVTLDTISTGQVQDAWIDRRFTNDTSYDYYRWNTRLPGTNSLGVNDVEVFETAPVGDIIIISKPLEAFSEPATGFILGLWEPVDTLVYDTDVLVDLSKDDGGTWEDTNLAKIGEAIIDVNDTPTAVDVVFGEIIYDTSGDQTMRSRLKSLNDKRIKFHGTIMDAE